MHEGKPINKGLTPEDCARERLKESFDQNYYRSLYKQLQIAFGDSLGKYQEVSEAAGGDFPDFEDIVVKQLKAGQSRKILNTSIIHLSKAMMAQPEPRWTQVDRWLNEVRKQCYIFRGRGDGYADGQWQTQNALAWAHGDALGVGFLHYEFRTDPSGKPILHKRSSSTLHTLWDPHEPDPSRSRYICFVRYVPAEVARARWGTKIDSDLADYGGESGLARYKALRVFDYYDLGYENGKPTRIVFSKSMINGQVLDHTENTLMCLPFVSYTHVLIPGMRRPVGRVVMQTASQEIINHIEDRLIRLLSKEEQDVMDSTYFDPKDVAAWENGGRRGVLKAVRAIPSGQKAFDRFPAPGFDVGALQAVQYFEQSFNTDAGTTDYDQSKTPGGDRTAFEAGLIQQQTAPIQNWTQKQVTEFYQRDAALFGKLFSKFDRSPLTVDIFGYNIAVNTSHTNSADVFFEEPSLIEIDEQSLTVASGDAKRARKLAELKEVQGLGLVGTIVNPIWFAEQVLRSLNLDPREAMGGAMGAAQQAMGPESGQTAQAAAMPPAQPATPAPATPAPATA